MKHKVCKKCKKKFTRPYRLGFRQWNKRKFCSQICWRESDIYRKSLFQGGHLGLKRENNGFWRGGRNFDGKYIKVLVGIKKYQREHRLVMEKHLGRKLLSEESIHHIDGDGTNNDIENLMLFDSEREHRQHHWSVARKLGLT